MPLYQPARAPVAHLVSNSSSACAELRPAAGSSCAAPRCCTAAAQLSLAACQADSEESRLASCVHASCSTHTHAETRCAENCAESCIEAGCKSHLSGVSAYTIQQTRMRVLLVATKAAGELRLRCKQQTCACMQHNASMAQESSRTCWSPAGITSLQHTIKHHLNSFLHTHAPPHTYESCHRTWLCGSPCPLHSHFKARLHPHLQGMPAPLPAAHAASPACWRG